MQEQYDNAFLGILQHEGTIFNFLDAIFSFLYRKTDFYLLMKDKHEKLGFPPGQALKILVNAFRKYEAAAKHDTERRLKKQQQAAAANAAAATTAMTSTTVAPVTAAAATVAITTAAATTAMTATTTGCAETTVIAAATTTGTATAATTVTAAVADQPQPKDVDTDNMRSPSGSTVHGASCPDSDTGSCTEQNTQTNGMNEMNKDDTCDTDLVTEESVAPADESGQAVGGDSGLSGRSVDSGQCPDAMEVGEGDIRKPEQHKSNSKKGEDSGDLELKRLQATFQANPESYNGAMRDNYSWSQSISDVDVRIEVPKHIKKGRDVRVDIQRKHLRMTYRDASGEWVTAVNGDLTWDINKEECVWTLVPQEHVHVNLEKVQERWWEAVLVSEPTINVRNIDPSRPMSDLDDEAQAKIQEMMFNERQKQLGLPTSDDQKMQEMLKKAWDAEGSPFRGQPFDPSKINLSGSNSLEING